METWVVVGLGNPGTQYALTPHNIGFMGVDSIAHHYDFPPFITQKNLAYTHKTVSFNGETHKVFLLKPHTFMNLSGNAVKPFITYHQIPLPRVIVIHDDLNLEPGCIKTRWSDGKQMYGHGGHNGLRHLNGCLSCHYHRIRLGIGHPGVDVAAYVLSPLSKQALHGWVADTLNTCVHDFPTWLEQAHKIT